MERDWPVYPDEDDARMDEDYGERCEECRELLRVRPYVYGEDADGNRGEWRVESYCPSCEQEVE